MIDIDNPSRSPAVALQGWTLASCDVDEQARLLPDWEQAYVQLEAGRLESYVKGVEVKGPLGLFRKTTNRKLHKYFSTPKNTCAVALLSGASERITFQGRDVMPGGALLLPPDQTYEIVCHGFFDVLVATLAASRIESQFSGWKGYEPKLRPRIARADRDTGALRQLLSSMIDGTLGALTDAATDKCVLDNLLKDLEDRLVNRVCTQGSAIPDSSVCGPLAELTLREARRIFIESAAELGEVPSVSEIACRLGVSVRLLHQVFRNRMGVPPRQYAQSLRLSRARSDLRAARAGEVTVAEVAAKWGFWHLGRFASTYRATFGELPSQSLRRSALGAV